MSHHSARSPDDLRSGEFAGAVLQVHDVMEHMTRTMPQAPPWPAVEAALRRRARRRRAMRTAAALVVVAVAAGTAASTGLIERIRPQPAVSTDTHVWPLDDGKPRGALGRDPDLPRQLAARQASDMIGDGIRRIADTRSVRVIFAGDVGDQRIVAYRAESMRISPVAALDRDVPARLDIVQVLTGARGTPVSQLVPLYTARLATEPGAALLVPTSLDGVPGLVGIVPRRSTVAISAQAMIGSDGIVRRDWTRTEVEDGVVVARLTGAGNAGTAVLRVLTAPGYPAGRPVAELALPWPGEAFDQIRRDTFSRPIASPRGGPGAATNVIQAAVSLALTSASMLPEEARVQVIWAGRNPADPGVPYTVIGVGLPGQGMLIQGSSIVMLRQQKAWEGVEVSGSTTAPGAPGRELVPWRLANPTEKAGATYTVAALLPDGTQRLEARDDVGARSVLLTDGLAFVAATPGNDVMLTARSASGSVLDRRTVSVASTGGSARPWLLPGEDPGAPPPTTSWPELR